MSAVVYVEPQDDVRSVRARIERVRGKAVGVAIPSGRPSFASPVALRLLNRQAAALGLELCVVTPDPALRELALAEGIPVFRSPASFERAARTGRPAAYAAAAREASSGGPLAGALGMLILLLALVAGVLVFVPEMTVTVTPRLSTVSETIQVVADPSQISVDVERRRIPGRPVRLAVDAVDQLAPGEGGAASDGRASGLVTFTNRTTEELEIPAGTEVATPDGIRFLTEQPARLEAGIGRVVRIRVVAEVSGEQGNVPRLRIATLLGPLETKAYAQNEDPMAGGGIPGSRVVTAVDRDRLAKRVAEKSRAEAEAQVKRSLSPGEMLVGQSLQFTPIETTFDADVGQEAQSLAVHFRAEAAGLVVSSEHLDRVGRQAWEPTAPAGFEVVEGSLRASAPEVAGTDGRATVVSLRLEAATRALVDAGRIEELSRWQSPAEIRRLLSHAYDLAMPPDVRFSPAWARRAFRVQVVVESGGAAAGS